MTEKIGRSRVVIRVIVWLLGVVLPAAPPAAAQTSKDLVGTWTIVTVTAEEGGTQVEPYGSNPKGILMFDENGRYSLVLLRPDLPMFASSNRTAGTPEENMAVVEGSIAHFGTYAVEGGDTTHLAHCGRDVSKLERSRAETTVHSHRGQTRVHGPSSVGWGHGPSGLDPGQVEISIIVAHPG